MQKILPHLWFDTEAEEAVKFYSSLFSHTHIGKTSRYGKAGFEIHGQPEGKVMSIEFELDGIRFLALNGGPMFKINPSISFLVACKSMEEVDGMYHKLVEGGVVRMELNSYPFSERYAWVEDKYGVNWQLMLVGVHSPKQKITPTLMFTGENVGKAEEAMNFYTSVFRRGSSLGAVMRYGPDESPDKEGTIKHGAFTIEGQEFFAMDSAHDHGFVFNEAISLMVVCDNQEEIDYYWNKLSEGGDPAAQQCGWLKDKYGLSWQITPYMLSEMLNSADEDKRNRVTEAFLQMKKFDIAELERVAEGKN